MSKKMPVYIVTNQKGGVGKTTTAMNLADGLTRQGRRVLLVDMDPQQGNLTQTLRADKTMQSVKEVMLGETTLQDIIQNTVICDLAPATIDLVEVRDKLTDMGREYKLKEALDSLPEGSYDCVIIDTPPSLDILTVNALVASDYIIVVTEADLNAMHGIGQLNAIVCNVRRYGNSGLSYAGILMNKLNERTNNGKEMKQVAEQLSRDLQTSVFASTIRQGVAVPDSMKNGESAWTWDKDSGPAVDYDAFAKEFAEKMGLTGKEA